MNYSVIFIVLLFITFSFAQKQHKDISKIEKVATEKYISNNNLKNHIYDGFTIINEDQVVSGNIIVHEGDLTVSGTVEGDILVLYGDIRIKNTARITGNVTCLDGSIFQAEKSYVAGNQIETSAKNLIKKDEWKMQPKNQYMDDENWIENDYRGEYSTLPIGFWKKQFLFRFNPVQGWFIGMSVPENVQPLDKYFDLYGFLGYGFSESRWGYSAGINRWLFDPYRYRFEIGAKGYDYTATNDSWIISPIENTLTSVFLHENYQDYFGLKGFEIHASQNFSIFFKATLAFRNNDYTSLKHNTDWALLYPGRKYKPNIEIDSGNMRSIYGELYYDTRNNKKTPLSGWYAKLSMEVSNPDVGGDFNFNQYKMEIRRYQKLGKLERLDMRFMAGSAEHDLPIQNYFYLGGFSSLRGFSYKEFSGNRALLANLEYNVSPRLMFSDFFLGAMRFILLFDFGTAWFTPAGDKWYEGFSSLTTNDIKFNYGIALSSQDGNFRLGIAKRTDRSYDAVKVTFRLRKPF